MDDNKQFLFTANGSYFGHCFIAFAFLIPILYGIIDRGGVDLKETNVFMGPLCVAFLLVFATMTEACMMIKTKRYLFAYNVDKALCVSLDNISWDSAVAIARRLYGPVFDEDCAEHFSSDPRSPCLRNLFYALIITLFVLSCPCRYFVNAIQAGTWSSELIAAWFLVCFDGGMIVNRLFFRPSIRRFWALTLGDDNFRSVLNFELYMGNDYAQPPSTVVTQIDELNGDGIPRRSKRVSSRFQLVVTGVILIAIVVWALNIRCKRTTRYSLQEINFSLPTGEHK